MARKVSARCFRNVCCLRTLGPLNNFKFHGIAFLECSITIAGYGRIVHEHIRAIIAPYETVALGIIEPFHCTLHFLWTSWD